ncbi:MULTISPECIES: hypothetical protein [Cupriavidus]|uniref:hypothetical protein n=1 Tax=Cupriavidus TaxID=106589 RepID=UPI0011EDC340|nr:MULTISPECIES: hypothetical protein [Cupriavidus]MWL91791.1 hypothetical protein [Cupriavidus sp. SW-Y-13]
MSQTSNTVGANYQLPLIPTIVKGNLKKGMGDIGASSGDLWTVDPFEIIVDEQYNVREKNKAYWAKVEKLRLSMLNPEIGFMRDSPLSVIVAKRDGKDVVILKRGYRRLEAAKRAIRDGANFTHVYAVATQRNLSDLERTCDLHLGNDGDKLSTFELAKLCKTASIYAPDVTTIAKGMELEPAYVEDLLMLIEGPYQITNWVRDEIIAASFAIDMLKKHAEKAAEVIQRTIDRARVTGSTKVSARHTPGALLRKAVTKAAPDMRVAIHDIKADPAFTMLAPDTKARIDTIFEALKKAEDEESLLNTAAGAPSDNGETPATETVGEQESVAA